MRVPIAWLRDYVELPRDAHATIERLASLGFPVDGVETRPTITNVVVGRIAKMEKHPNADRLQVCTIDIGGPTTLTIATAATNVAEGQVVPVAKIGAQLPGMKIEPRKMRGIASEGMLCSGGELGLEADWFEDGIMQLDTDTPLGLDVVELFGLDDPVLDVDVTPNRVDAMSMLGLARELAASFRTTVQEPAFETVADGESNDVRVTLESFDAKRYVVQRVGGLTVRTAKAMMRVRLALAGQRPINNLVDISNYVMMELGQPLHFFDFEKIANAHIIVRDPRPGEHLTTLDGTDRELGPTALLIADDQQATGLAGLMGGQISEVSDTTREVAIESANWTGPRIRRMSVALGLRTEASSRNEKNLPIALTDLAAARAAYLLAEEGGHVRAARAYGEQDLARTNVRLPKHDVRRYLGFTLHDDEIAGALRSLGFAVDDAGDGTFAVTPPPWRSDITIAADLVEEVARVVGYDRLESVMPPVGEQPLSSAAFDRENELAVLLAGLGYRECLTLSLQPGSIAERDRALGIDIPKAVEIVNPLSEDQRFLRYDALHAHLALIARDAKPRPYRTFEIGRVFTDAPDAPHESNLVTMVSAVPPRDEPKWRSSSFLEMKGDVIALVRAISGREATATPSAMIPLLHPGKSAMLTIDGEMVGAVGIVDPRLTRAYDLGDDVTAAFVFVGKLTERRAVAFLTPSRYPAIERDLALIVDQAIAAGEMVAAVRAVANVVAATVFDEYRGAQIDTAKKSLGLRVTLQRNDATLTDAIADETLRTIVAMLTDRFGAVLRS